jgi:hypothetical protein
MLIWVKSMKCLFLCAGALALSLVSMSASAMSVDWSGTYRFEYTEVGLPYLTGVPAGQNPDRGSKAYFLNHLNLSPKIIAMDGVNVIANMEVFPSLYYPGSQLGTDFGAGPNNPTNQPYPNSGPSGDMAQGAGYNGLQVNQVYMTWNHEYGELVAGRMPIQFGLGITHNAGNGMFDHWLDTHDIVGYKVVMGNLSVMPMYGRMHRAFGYANGGSATEGMINLDYTNPETESTFAIFHQIRSAGQSSNDSNLFFAPYENTAGTSPQVVGGLSTTQTSLYIARGWEKFKFKMEASFLSGNTGVQYNNYLPEVGVSPQAGNTSVNLSGYGIAVELQFPRPDSNWQWNVRTGMASGDDPRTQNFEGFFFNKNYDVAMLLFNHPMGTNASNNLGNNNYNVLRNNLGRQRNSQNQIYSNDQAADEDALSNAEYISPKLDYLIGDHWEWNNALTYAMTQVNPSAKYTPGSDIGWEYDVGITYKPHEKFRWITRLGLFLPGSVWQEGSAGRDVNLNYGWETKAAISF